jgi:hypothetical protein
MPKPWRDRSLIKRIAALLGALTLSVAGIGAASAQIPSRGNIRIVNLGNAALNYEIRPNNGLWTQQRIEPGGTASFDCTGCSAFEARLKTPGKDDVVRTLPLGPRYQIFWNEAANAWDIGVSARR